MSDYPLNHNEKIYALSDDDLVIAWNAAYTTYGDAVETLNTGGADMAVIEHCRKSLVRAADRMVALRQEADRRKVTLKRRSSEFAPSAPHAAAISPPEESQGEVA